MKLKTFILTVLIASFLFSCSSDSSEPPVVITPVEIDASLSLAVDKIGLSKAVKIVEPFSDSGISTLTVAVFDNGAYLDEDVNNTYADNNNPLKVLKTISVEAEVSSLDLLEITDIPIPGGDLKVLVLANVEKLSLSIDKTTLADVLALETYLEKEEPDKLTMSSAVLDIKTYAEVKNYLGYGATEKSDGVLLSAAGASANGVDLYRTPARVQLKSITVGKEAKLANSETIGEIADLKVNSVFIMNAKRTSKIASSGIWGFVESSGNYWYAGAHSTETGIYKVHDEQLGEEVTYLKKEYTELSITPGKSNSFVDAFYIYENGLVQNSNKAVNNHNGDYTLLVIQADFTFTPTNDDKKDQIINYLKDASHNPAYVYEESGSTITVKDCFYTVVINDGVNCGTNGVDLHTYVKRNVKYEISATINSIGSNSPVDLNAVQYINARVVVADWNVVTIDDDDLW